MSHLVHRLLVVWVVCLLAANGAHAASARLEDLLARPTPPPGVVFEIVDRDADALDVALPWVKQAAQRLKQRFPGLPMALVTHGQEMFALQTPAGGDTQPIHELAQSLSRDQGIPVHVCETYAASRGLAAEDFPDYVDVAPEGPAQIRNYEALDYVRVVVPAAAVLRAVPHR
jgi:intracellular sulfur oxidation DsrE/DsrF family protein